MPEQKIEVRVEFVDFLMAKLRHDETIFIKMVSTYSHWPYSVVKEGDIIPLSNRSWFEQLVQPFTGQKKRDSVLLARFRVFGGKPVNIAIEVYEQEFHDVISDIAREYEEFMVDDSRGVTIEITLVHQFKKNELSSYKPASSTKDVEVEQDVLVEEPDQSSTNHNFRR